MSYLRHPEFRAGARAGAPYAVAAGLVGVSFGLLAEPIVGGPVAILMSITVFAGSAQFAAVAVLGAGGSIGAALLAAVLLNARYVTMGIALAPSTRGGPLRRSAYGAAMIDASWAMASRGDGRFDPDFMVGATAPTYPAWVGGTIIGVFGGGIVSDPSALGLDALFPAFFLALLVGEIRSRRALGVAAVGAAIALALVPITPPGVPIIAAAAATLLGLAGGNGLPTAQLEEDPVG